ncbi:MAG: hypothetical protein ACR2OU_14280 [Thermomicrobiales bacterium]
MSQQTEHLLPDEEQIVTGRRPIGARLGTHETDGHDSIEVKNRVQIGPIIAGILTAIAVMLILTVLGLAIGTSALEPRDIGQKVGTGAAIWGIVSAIIAFFLGGWVAAKTAAVAGAGSGTINGLMVGFAILIILLWMTISGVSGLLGSIGGNINDITNVLNNQGGSVQQVQQQAQQVDPKQVFNTAKDSAWITLAGIVIPLIAAAIGGMVGHNERREVIQSGR